MVVDFHTHIFPDKIALSTVGALQEKSNNKPYSDGTANGLIEKMLESGVQISINLLMRTQSNSEQLPASQKKKKNP